MWESLLGNTPDAILAVDREGIIQFLNRTPPDITLEQMVGSRIYDHVAPEYRQSAMEAIADVFDTGKPRRHQTVGLGPKHTYSCYETWLAPIRRNDEITAVMVIARDVTGRVGAEEALRESEQKFRDLANLLPQTVFEIDLNGNFIFANNFGLNQTGYVQEDIDGGLNVLALFSPEDKARVMRDIERTLTGQEFGNHEYTLLRKDGSQLPVMAYTSPVIQDGKIMGMRGIILDISERKRVEEEVLQRNRELAALTAIAQTVNQSLDLDSILDQSLDKMLEALDIECGGIYLVAEDADRMHLRIHRGVDEGLLENISEVKVGEGVPGIVLQSRAPMFIESLSDAGILAGGDKGVPDVAEARRSMMCLPLKARDKMLGVLFAMSPQERIFTAEERDLLVTIGHEISTAVENSLLLETESRAKALEEADHLRTAFLASISHVTSIKGIATTLIQTDVEWDAETQREFLGCLSQETDRLVHIVNDILDMSRIEAGIMHLEKRPTSIAKVIRQLSGRWDDASWNHTLKWVVPEDLPRVMADEIRIEQVITNLVNNAAAYSPAGTEIAIEATEASGEVVVSVTDQGDGVPAEQIDRVFDHFYRLEENTDRKMSGSGLGLAICRGIIAAHDGRIWVESEFGKGATFRFALPVVSPSESADHHRQELERLLDLEGIVTTKQ